VSLRMIGELAVLEHAAQSMDDLPVQVFRKGEMRHKRIQPANVLSAELAVWERGGTYPLDDRDAILAEERAHLTRVAGVVERLAPMLAGLDRSKCEAELYISTIRYEEMGGFGLPANLVAAAGKAALSIGISILIGLDDDEPVQLDDNEREV
jgi:hypothetical protein